MLIHRALSPDDRSNSPFRAAAATAETSEEPERRKKKVFYFFEQRKAVFPSWGPILKRFRAGNDTAPHHNLIFRFYEKQSTALTNKF